MCCERFETLPDQVDLEAVAAIRPANRPEVDYWRENLELAIRKAADPGLIDAIESCLHNLEPEPEPEPEHHSGPAQHRAAAARAAVDALHRPACQGQAGRRAGR